MKPPIETIRVSARGRETLTRIKKNTGLEHWNEVCRLALCLSLANPNVPQKPSKFGDSSIEMEWKTFAGSFQEELTSLIIFRAQNDGIDLSKKDNFSDYFKSHLERGIIALQNVKFIADLFKNS